MSLNKETKSNQANLIATFLFCSESYSDFRKYMNKTYSFYYLSFHYQTDFVISLQMFGIIYDDTFA